MGEDTIFDKTDFDKIKKIKLYTTSSRISFTDAASIDAGNSTMTGEIPAVVLSIACFVHRSWLRIGFGLGFGLGLGFAR
jgi:hypothetical protein